MCLYLYSSKRNARSMLNEIEVGLICLSERKKFKEVYEEYFTALKYFAMRYVKDEEVACDLLQDIFVKLW